MSTEKSNKINEKPIKDKKAAKLSKLYNTQDAEEIRQKQEQNRIDESYARL